VDRAPEIHLGDIGRPRIARVERVEHVEPARVRVADDALRAFDIADKTVESDEHRLRVALAEGGERDTQRVPVPLAHPGRGQSLVGPPPGGAELGKTEMEEGEAA